MIAEGLLGTMRERLATGLTSLSTFKGSVLEGVKYRHPLAEQVATSSAHLSKVGKCRFQS